MPALLRLQLRSHPRLNEFCGRDHCCGHLDDVDRGGGDDDGGGHDGHGRDDDDADDDDDRDGHGVRRHCHACGL